MITPLSNAWRGTVRELPIAIPDADALLNLEPEELAAKMLFLVRARREEMFHPRNLQNELWSSSGAGPQYPIGRQVEISLAVREAWAWLEAQGLIVPAEDSNGQNGWRVLSRRARRFESEAAFADYKVAQLLPKELLHPTIKAFPS